MPHHVPSGYFNKYWFYHIRHCQFCAKIISPLVGTTPYHIKNTLDFVNKIGVLKLGDDEELVSYDVTALFTSVPVEEALDIIQPRLENDTTLHERTNLNPSQIVELLRFVLTTTYFTFQDQVYQQIEGAAMGSPCSPLVANIFMEAFEEEAINTSPVKPSYWGRYVDGTMVVLKTDDIDTFTLHLNSVNPAIKFTIEREEDGKLPMLDTLLHRKPDGSIKVTVYQKPTHTNQYLSFESHHPLQHKLSVVRTLMHRADTCITEEADKINEKNNIKKSLRMCGYGDWVYNVAQPATAPDRQHVIRDKPHVGSIVVPYVRGASEALRRIFSKRGVSVHFKPANTLRSALVAPKDKIPPGKCCGTVYQVSCNDCDSAYVGESARPLNTRIAEHRRPSTTTSPVGDHQKAGHSIEWKDVKILDRETDWFRRGVKESIHIRTSKSDLNKDQGRHRLSGAYNSLLRQSMSRDSRHGSTVSDQ
ncbi:uncharacterized protein [Amphiura filiformis]|uniref:uncharacterized protein n=1 Tax=Amphiura filiformis TaxID=82378 RepID=UPI003B222523